MLDRKSQGGARCLIRVALLLVAVGLLGALPVAADEDAGAVGSVRTLAGSAVIIRQGQELPVALGDRLLAEDVVRTGADGSIGIVLRDDTLVSLGPASELEMTEFDFRPDESAFSLVINLVKGTFVYMSGRIGKLAPEAVKVETPVGIVAVRGTRFLVKIV
jgi:hypothetical protein